MSDTLDVLSLEEAKEAVRRGASDDRYDNVIARLVTTVSRRLDEAIGPVVSRTVTDERATGWRTKLELSHGPILSVSSVVEYQSGTGVTLTQETHASVPSDGYLPERYAPNPALLSGVLIRRVSGHDACWWEGHGNVLVTYVAGRVADTTSVDARHKEAAVLMLRNLWRSYENAVGQVDEYDVPVASFPAFALPNAVKDLLTEELQTSAGFG